MINFSQKDGVNYMSIGERIKERRTELNLSVDELAARIGKNRATVYRYESHEIENLTLSTLEPLAKALDTTPGYLMGWEENKSLREIDTSIGNPPSSRKKGVVINVLGRVAAGVPIEAIEDIIDTEEIPVEMARTGKFFGLLIHGDSMIPNICDGDIVIVRQQEDAETGDIVIATVNGTDATCKRLRKYKDGIELISNNPTYDPLDFSNQAIIEKPVRIIGKVVELRRKF